MPSVPTASIRLPERYRVLRHIASGGMASVWEARDEVLQRDVAVKVLAVHLTEDETARMRFQREARAAAGLSGHPNVVTIYDVGEHEGRSFIVMELMRGGSVADVLRGSEPIPVAKALGWLRHAAAALDAAHDAGIVHRDVKPANMLLDQRERLALADFGIARLAYGDQVTATGTVLGTSTYISPEQALGQAASAASDRYALAAVAFELLTLTRPFPAEHFAAQARAHIEDPPPAASERRPELDPAVDPVIQRGMAKDPQERWPSAAELVDQLESALHARAASPAAATVVAAPTAATRVAPVAPPPRRPLIAEPAAAERGPRGRRWWPVAVAAALLALTAVAAALVLTSGGDGGRDGSADRAAERPEPTATPTATPTASPTPRATPAPASTREPTPAPGQPDEASARALNDQGFSLFRRGSYAEALAPLERAYELCQGSTAMDPCGYATYNYGAALNRSGDPAAAIPILEERMRRFGDNRDGDVAEELESARESAAKPGKGRGKGRKKG